MKEHWKNLRIFPKIVFCISLFGVGHFILAFVCWTIVLAGAIIMQYKGQHPDWTCFWPSLITFALLGLFTSSAYFAWKSKRAATLLLCLSIIMSAICFAYEAKNEKWQIQMMTKEGCKHSYCNWPFYDGPN